MGFLVSLFGGPLAGLLGSLVSGVFGYFEKKQQIEADKARYAHEAKLQEMNIAARGQELEQEALIAQTQAMAEMMKGSYDHDASYTTARSPAVATALPFFRPLVTITLVGATVTLAFHVSPEGVIQVGDETMTIREKVIGSIIFMSEAAVTWWFADRRRSNK